MSESRQREQKWLGGYSDFRLPSILKSLGFASREGGEALSKSEIVNEAERPPIISRVRSGKWPESNKRKVDMGEYSEIEWTDHTFNPWMGCTNVSPGCDHCYAESLARRYGHAQWGNHPRKRTSEANWKKPLSWNAKAEEFKGAHGRRQRVFCASMADVFDNQVPEVWRQELFALIGTCRQLDWLLLTKRPQNVQKMLPSDWGDGYRNVWLGVTAEDQLRFDQRWKYLQRIPAVIKFISYEPAIGPLRLPKHGPYPDWLISGGESGAGARPMDPQWARDIIADCRRESVVPFHKQWGSYQSNPLVVERGESIKLAKQRDPFGKGGGLVDGELVRQFPVRPRRADRGAA
jgi:protein gp37